MKAGGEDTNAHELVLIRRRLAGDDAPHKGGVWKIAYADFMTAMMAFFLVMWLINSTDQRVLTQVANYFNPMRLTDNTPQERGLNNIESGEQGKQGKQPAVGDPKDKLQTKDNARNKRPVQSSPADESAKRESNAQPVARYTEQVLFSDPYGILARIAAEAPTDVAATPSNETSTAGVDSFRDPFDPAAQRAVPDKRSIRAKGQPAAQDKQRPKGQPAPQDKEAVAAQQGGEAKTPQDTKLTPKVVQGPEAEKLAPAAGGEAKAPTQDAKAMREATPPAEQAKAPTQDAKAMPEATPSAEQPKSDPARIQEALRVAKEAAEQKAARDEAATIETDIKRVAAELKGMVPNIDVTVTDDGVLISLTDDQNFGMFAIASAEPRPAMVAIMEKIAKIVQAYPQPLTVRGHTDGRPYRSVTYDNWRLSTARAHMAYYMLVRGGVDEKRFERVEGYADRKLRVPSDPEAAQNRRIEILLRRPKP